VSTSTSESIGFAHGAAKGSWLCTILAVVLFQIGKRTGQVVMFELLGLLAIMAGLLLGVIALFGIPKYGAKGILGSALTGIAINGLLVFIFVTNFIAAREKARRGALDLPPAMVLSAQDASCERRPWTAYAG
jgi:hypothetical protein